MGSDPQAKSRNSTRNVLTKHLSSDGSFAFASLRCHRPLTTSLVKRTHYRECANLKRIGPQESRWRLEIFAVPPGRGRGGSRSLRRFSLLIRSAPQPAVGAEAPPPVRRAILAVPGRLRILPQQTSEAYSFRTCASISNCSVQSTRLSYKVSCLPSLSASIRLEIFFLSKTATKFSPRYPA